MPSKDKRDRKFTGVIYPDSVSYDCEAVLQYVNSNFDCAYILHDCDVIEETGEIKKPHYHLVFRWASGSARTLASVGKEIGLPDEEIHSLQYCGNLDGALLYLVHDTDESKDKAQYSPDDVKGNLKARLLKIQKMNADGREEDEVLGSLIQWIEEQPSHISTASFMRYCCESGTMDFYRKFQMGFHRIIDEHNNYNKHEED